MEITIVNLKANPDTVTVTYNVTDSLDDQGNAAVYSTEVPFDDAPNQQDLISTDNYTHYSKIITG